MSAFTAMTSLNSNTGLILAVSHFSFVANLLSCVLLPVSDGRLCCISCIGIQFGMSVAVAFVLMFIFVTHIKFRMATTI